jgi:Gluconate 2-dehydrogenase subunit 3
VTFSFRSEPYDSDQLAALAVLADGIIPPDEIDGGAGEVHAATRIAEKIRGGANTALYREGLATAATLAKEVYDCSVPQLTAEQTHELLARLRERLPAFFKQLRIDVSALYLSDPAVWQRIGFPGPSTASGGYPDFDQPQA